MSFSFDLKSLCYGKNCSCTGTALFSNRCRDCLVEELGLNGTDRSIDEKKRKKINNLLSQKEVDSTMTMKIMKKLGYNDLSAKALTMHANKHREKGEKPTCKRCGEVTFIRCCGSYPI